MSDEIQRDALEAREAPQRRKATDRQREAGINNLMAFNRSRAGKLRNLEHGVSMLITKGEVPPVPGADEAAARVDTLIGEVVSDLGGPDAITGTRRAILASLRLALLVVEIGRLYIAKHGMLDSTGKPHPLLTVMNSYGNSVRHASLALGLERLSKDALTLDAVLEDIAQKRGKP